MTSRSASCETGGRASASGCERSASCAGSIRLRDRAAGLPRPGRRAAAWLTSPPPARSRASACRWRRAAAGCRRCRRCSARRLRRSPGRNPRSPRGSGWRCRRRSRAGAAAGAHRLGGDRALARRGPGGRGLDGLAALADQTDAWAGLALAGPDARACWPGWCRSTSHRRRSRKAPRRAVSSCSGGVVAGATEVNVICARSRRTKPAGDVPRAARGEESEPSSNEPAPQLVRAAASAAPRALRGLECSGTAARSRKAAAAVSPPRHRARPSCCSTSAAMLLSRRRSPRQGARCVVRIDLCLDRLGQCRGTPLAASLSWTP